MCFGLGALLKDCDFSPDVTHLRLLRDVCVFYSSAVQCADRHSTLEIFVFSRCLPNTTALLDEYFQNEETAALL